MAAITNTYQTYQAKGLREDLSDTIYNISPEDTPFMSNIGRGTVKNSFFEWQTDSLAAADTTNAVIEGNDPSFTAQTPTSRVGNYTQISDKVFLVSDTMEAVDKAGRRSEVAYLTAKASSELKRDMEAIALANQAAAAGSSSVARATGGLPAWLKSNTVFESAGSDPVYTNIPVDARDDGTADAFVEDDIKEGMREAWTNGGKPTMLLLGAFNKQAASTFSGVATKTFYQSAVEATKIIGAADVYVSDFGTLALVPSRFQRGRDAFGIDPEMASIVTLQPFRVETLAKTGHADKRMVTVEWGLKVHNEAAHFGIYDLTTS